MSIVSRIVNKIFKLDPEVCESCETLKEILNQERHEKKQLLETILELNKPKVEEVREPFNPEELAPKIVPWRIRQHMLESEDRKKAEILKKKQEEIKELEIRAEIKEENENVS